MTEEELPTYAESTETNISPTGFSVAPDTFYAAERFIYDSQPNGLPIYELSHSLGFLGDSDRTVRFQRLDRQVKHSAGSAPQITTRQRCLYDLKHPAPGTFPTVPFHAEPSSRQALCKFGLESCRAKGRLFTKGFRICRATRPGKSVDDEKSSTSLVTRRDGRGVTNALALGDELFTAVPTKDKSTFEWLDANGTVVAREGRKDQQLLSFSVLTEMSGPSRDALMASWILRVWYDLAQG